MEFHQVRYFEAAARLGSMMAAAAECHVSQPALSVQIRKLEEEAGTRLLLREARGVRLTPAGERTLLAARRILREASGWAGDMRLRDFGEARTLRVVVQPFLTTELLPGPLVEMLRTAPPGGLRLRFRERAPEVIPGFLRSGGADLALIDLSATPMPGFVTEVLFRIPYALFVPQLHPMARSDAPINLAGLLAEPLLVYTHAPGLELRLAELAAGMGGAWEPGFSSEHASGIFELVAAGAGVAVLPLVFTKAAARRGVRVRPLADYDAVVSVALAYREGEPPGAPAVALIEHLRRAYRPMAGVAVS